MKKNNIFWIGYSDLMTSLFFIMLVISVITVGVKQAQLNKIKELQTAVQQLPKDYFDYQPQFKRFKLKEQIQFSIGSSEIAPKYNNYLISVGSSINGLISRLDKNPEYKKLDIKYLIVIEGMASKDNFPQNFELSYERSLALYNLWKRNGINFNPESCEIQIAGSGTDGIRTDSLENEFKNQQFLIHIVPKMGNVD